MHGQQNVKTHFMFSKFFLILWKLLDNVEKYCKDGPATDDITAHTHCMLDTQGHRHTLGICDYINMQQSLHVRVSLSRYT